MTQLTPEQWAPIRDAVMEYGSHFAEASLHQSASRADISQSAALATLQKIRQAVETLMTINIGPLVPLEPAPPARIEVSRATEALQLVRNLRRHLTDRDTLKASVTLDELDTIIDSLAQTSATTSQSDTQVAQMRKVVERYEYAKEHDIWMAQLAATTSSAFWDQEIDKAIAATAASLETRDEPVRPDGTCEVCGEQRSEMVIPCGTTGCEGDAKAAYETLQASVPKFNPVTSAEDYLRNTPDTITPIYAVYEYMDPVEAKVQKAVFLPHPGTVEVSALLDSILEEYNYPTNSKNAARAGWTAAMRYIAAPIEGKVVAPGARFEDWFGRAESLANTHRRQGWNAAISSGASTQVSGVPADSDSDLDDPKDDEDVE